MKLLFVLLLVALASTALAQELEVLPQPQEAQFPNGYDVIDSDGKLLKALPDSHSANVHAFKDKDGVRLFMSDWSFRRFRDKGIEPNWIRSRTVVPRRIPTDSQGRGKSNPSAKNHGLSTPGRRSSDPSPTRLVPNIDCSLGSIFVDPPAASSKAVPRIMEPAVYEKVALDMKENLLVATTGGLVDFWDVQTGSLIRRVTTSASSSWCALHNLGEGFFVRSTISRWEGSLQWFHRDAAEPLCDARPASGGSRNSRRFCLTGDVSAPRVGLVAFTHDEEGLVLGARNGRWRSFRADGRLHQPPALALSPDGKILMTSPYLASTGEMFLLSAYSLADGRRLGEYRLPNGARDVLAICAANGADEFFVLTSTGQLLRYHARRGLMSEEESEVQFTLGSDYFWLCGTEQGWCIFGGPSQTRATKDAPDAVHRTVTQWNDVDHVALDRSGEYAAVLSAQGHLLLYDLKIARVVRRFGIGERKDVEMEARGVINLDMRGSASSSGPLFMQARDSDFRKSPEVRVFDQLELTQTRYLVPRPEAIQKGFQLVGAGLGRERRAFCLVHADKSGGLRRADSPVEGYPLLHVTDLNTMEFEWVEVPRDLLKGHYRVEGEFILAETIVGSDRCGVAIEGSTGEVVRTFRYVGLPPTVGLIAFHRQSGAGLLVDFEANVVLLHPGAAAEVSGVWRPEIPYNAYLEAVFDPSGNRAVIAGWKKGQVLSMLDLSRPGRILWERDDVLSRVLRFTEDGRWLLVGDDGDWGSVEEKCIRLLDASTGQDVASFLYHGSCAAISEDVSRAYISSPEGGYRIVEIRDRQFRELARYMPAEGESFALVLPSGYYLTHGNALERISFSKDGRGHPAESYDVKYNRPDLVAEAFGAAPELVRAFRCAYEKRLKRLGIRLEDLASDLIPPEVAIDYGRIPLSTSQQSIRLPVKAKPGSSPLVALEVTINDVPVLGRGGRSLEGLQAQGIDEEIYLPLGAGLNKITVWTRDARGLTSSRASVELLFEDPRPTLPTLFVVAVGIDDYAGTDRDLALAGKDASDIAALFEQVGRTGFSEVKTKVIKDKAATREGVLETARTFLQQTDLDDHVILFMAGHGVLDTDFEYRFCCADFDPALLPTTTLTYDEIESIFDGCRARKRIVMLDTCHAGEADRDDTRLAAVDRVLKANARHVEFMPFIAKGVNPAGLGVTDLLARHFVDLRIGAGAAVLASSSAHQVALEASGDNNGLFTASVLKGLQERKADRNGDKIVRVSELLEYCRDEVKRLSGNLQEPVARHYNLSEDFVIARFQ